MFGKLFSSMYDGTLAANGPWQALVTFQQLIILADQDGNVDMTAAAIARRTSLPLEIIKQGIEELSKPDPESRTPDEEGRRISLLEDHRPWGWRIVNYAKYRDLRKAEDRRDYLRLKKQESRERIAAQQKSTPVNNPSTNVNTSTHTETDIEEEEEVLVSPAPPAPAPRRPRNPAAAKSEAPTNVVWNGYARAYELRYGAEPVRNAKVNGQLATLLSRLGVEASDVAAHFLSNQNRLYVNSGHAIDLLLRDAEKLRTEWYTGRQVTGAQAIQADRTQTNLNAFAPLIAEAEARERGNHAD